jgi:putative selenium metabolism protein SsnA
MSALLVANGTVVTLGEANRVLPAHDLLVENGRVARIAPHGRVAAEAPRTLDATRKLVLPGFINAHTHFYSTLARGLGKARPSRDFRQVLERLWWRLDRALTLEDCRLSALVVLLEAVRKGTTTLIDHHASPGAVRGSLDALAEAVGASGLRACLCYEVSDRDGAGVAREGIDENAAFVRRVQGEDDPLLRALFGLHASFTVGDETLERAAREARELGVGCHVHAAEALADQEHCLAAHGQRVVERLASRGVLGPRSIAAHCVHVDEREIDVLAATGTAVVHNPQSNLNNAVGVADVVGMVARGVLVGLGTDAMTVHMPEELRVALWSQHHAREDPSVGFVETVSALTSGNACIAGRLWPGLGLGTLSEGGAADLILVDYDPPTPLTVETFPGHLVFGVSQATVETTVVGGRVLMERRRLCLDLDEAEVAAKAREAAARLWDRF